MKDNHYLKSIKAANITDPAAQVEHCMHRFSEICCTRPAIDSQSSAGEVFNDIMNVNGGHDPITCAFAALDVIADLVVEAEVFAETLRREYFDLKDALVQLGKQTQTGCKPPKVTEAQAVM